jgi:hypothetical protein
MRSILSNQTILALLIFIAVAIEPEGSMRDLLTLHQRLSGASIDVCAPTP